MPVAVCNTLNSIWEFVNYEKNAHNYVITSGVFLILSVETWKIWNKCTLQTYALIVCKEMSAREMDDIFFFIVW